MISVRPYREADAIGLLALFRDTIREVNSADYTAEQIGAWASSDICEAVWTSRFEGRIACVAEIEGMIAGFSDMEINGHIDRFFVSSFHQRRGVGRSMLSTLLFDAKQLGLSHLFTEASITALPFFEAHEFRVLAEQRVICRGVEMKNFRMERTISYTSDLNRSSHRTHHESV